MFDKYIMNNNIDKLPKKLYFHCALMGRYKEVLSEQLKVISESKLFQNVELNFVVLGKRSDFPDKLISNRKYKVHDAGTNFGRFEFATLQVLYQDSISTNSDFIIGYMHTKGTSKSDPGDIVAGDSWRREMMQACVQGWTGCLFLLKLVDACGWRWHPDINEMGKFGVDVDGTHGFFYGNYWWTTASYVRTLKPISQINQNNRYEAQMWIAKSNKEKLSYHCLQSGKIYTYSK